MLLAIDIGNSEISFGIFKKEEIINHWNIETRPNRASAEYAALVFSLLANSQFLYSDIKDVAISSVVPSVDIHIREFCEKFINSKPFFISSNSILGFSLNVDTPLEIGADRLANTAYAISYMQLPALVIDIGTAITFDYISERKSYEGGLILPGFNMAVKALNIGTAKLPPVDLSWPSSIIGKNTSTCIQSGLLYGYCSMLDGLIRKFKTHTNRALDVAITGGLSFLVKDKLETKTTYIKHLTLQGIRLIYELNKAS